MKLMFAVVLGILLISGCVSAPEEITPISEEDLQEDLVPLNRSLIKVDKDGTVTTITIKSVTEGKRPQFPLENYTDQFLDVNIHSDTFIQLNNTHIESLDEEESFWLTPYVRNNTGIMFNSIYSKDIDECNPSTVKILGTEYLTYMLKDGEAFESDDKWKVELDKEDGCLKRVIINQYGYFYGLKNNDQINLFRNDNTVLAYFEDLETEPTLKIIFTEPIEKKS